MKQIEIEKKWKQITILPDQSISQQHEHKSKFTTKTNRCDARKEGKYRDKHDEQDYFGKGE